MPELPEVETVVRDLRPLVVGCTIRGVLHGPKSLRKPWDAAWNATIVGTRITGVRRRGKWIVAELSSPSSVRRKGKNEPRLIVHLGMTGRLTAVDAREPVPDHLHVVFDLDGKRELRFRDPRRFGSVTLHADEAAVEAFFLRVKLGPEPLAIDPEYFHRVVRESARTLKALLLDQSILAGMGNIYADEACFRARLHPARQGQSLTNAEADRLRAAVESVLAQAIAGRGSTIRDYVGGSGQAGGFQNEHRVYGRTGQPCPTCGTAVVRVILAGRSSHYCPMCQPVPQSFRSTA